MKDRQYAISHLKRLGQERGFVTVEDIADNVPLTTLTAKDLALVINELEEAGVMVEVDPALLSPLTHGVAVAGEDSAASIGAETNAHNSGPPEPPVYPTKQAEHQNQQDRSPQSKLPFAAVMFVVLLTIGVILLAFEI